MNSKQRIAAALRGEAVDRIPFMCQISMEHYFLALGVDDWAAIWLNPDRFAAVQMDLCKRYGMDGVLVNVYPSYTIWNGIKNIKREDDRETVTFADGTEGVFTKRGDELYDWKKTENKADTLDFDPTTLNYPEPTNDYFDSLRAFDDDFLEEHSLHWELQSPFDHLVDLFGISEAMMAVIEDPDMVKAVLEKALQLEIKRAKGAFSQGVKIDAIKISSPYVGQAFLSPADYTNYVVPFEKRLVDAVREMEPDMPVYLHTCGSLNDRLELIIETGFQAIECLDPAPLGNVDLEDACHRLKGHMAIKGNLDSVNLLSSPDNAEIEKEVIRCLELGKRYKSGYILSTACSTAPSVQPETMIFVRELVEKHGWVSKDI